MKSKQPTFYVTTPIYYPSGNLHIGHVYTTTLAWVLRNYKTLNGFDAIFLTGADEHGQKIELKAQSKKLSPQAYVDQMRVKFKKLWKDLAIDYDYFSRTSSEKHKKMIQKQFALLEKQKDIYLGHYEGLYSVQDEEFVTINNAIKKEDKYYHPESNHLLEKRDENTYFFKVNQFQEWLTNYYKEHPHFIIPSKIKNELEQSFFAKGLQDLSITRANFSWGVPILSDPQHVVYVWFDALHNYLSALGYQSDDESNYLKYWKNGDEIVHIIGREISRFHCIYWPLFLKAANLRQPNTIITHGWIITPEGKMSKSKGNVIDPYDLINKYGPERVKYFFASQISIGHDGVFDQSSFENVVNADLTNNYGNLLSRTLSMINQNFDQPIKHQKTKIAVDQAILKAIIKSKKDFIKQMDTYQIDQGLLVAINLSKKLNGYIDATKPWTLKEKKERLAIVLNNLLNGLYAITTMLSVVIPQAASKAKKQLNIKTLDLNLINDFTKFDKIEVKKGSILFERIK